MIDLHCHLLPGIDDGARTLDDAMTLAQMAYNDGIRKLVLTPHIHPGRFDNNKTTIQPVFLEFKRALQERNIPLEVGMSAEMHISPELLLLVQKDLVPYLGEIEGYRILLLEMPYSHVPPGSDKVVRWLMERRIRPMLAHPERNDVLQNIEKIHPFIQQGCMVQITASSITGRFGAKPQQCTHKLLERGWVDIIATDAHNQSTRPPDLESGRMAAAKIIGEAAAWNLVHGTPERITINKFNEVVQ